MSDISAAPAAASGASLSDLNSTQKGGVQNLGQIALSLQNVYPAATTTTSPVATGFNNLGTTATALVGASTGRHGVIFHNPGIVDTYIFPTGISTTPTTALLGGAFWIGPGATLLLPASLFANVNCAWSGFCATGSSNPLTVIEFK